MNLFVSVTDDVLGDCTSDGGLNYQALADKVFLLTYIDCVGGVPQGVYLWTNRRGVLIDNATFGTKDDFSWQTPIVLHPAEVVCLTQNDEVSPIKLLVSGVLSPAP